jgi:hypothetical protein
MKLPKPSPGLSVWIEPTVRYDQRRICATRRTASPPPKLPELLLKRPQD